MLLSLWRGVTLQAATREMGAAPRQLAGEIDELGKKGVLPAAMTEWAHEIRALRNIGAHPDATETSVEAKDANDIVKFLDYFLIYVYNLPKEIEQYRTRRDKSP